MTCYSNFKFTTTVSAVIVGNKTAAYYGCTSTLPWNAGATNVFAAVSGTLGTIDGTTTMTTAVSGSITMWAQPITVAFQKKDLLLFTTTSSSSSDLSSSTSSPYAINAAVPSREATSAALSTLLSATETPQAPTGAPPLQTPGV